MTQAGKRDGTEAWAYVDKVISGDIVTSKKVIKLCKTLKKRQGNGYKDWHYDADKAARPCNFIERFCCQPEGKAGSKITLLEFQLFFIQMLFGWVDEDGVRQFQECFLIMGRKNGKTTIAAALTLYMLVADGEQYPQCYSAANDAGQASLTYGSTLVMKNHSPLLTKRLHKGVIPARHCDGLICKSNSGYFTPLSSRTDGLDGLNVHFATLDEMAASTDRGVYDLIQQATSAREQPILLEITTNGFVRGNLFDSQYDHAKRVLNGKEEADRFLPIIYELDSRAEWEHPECWIKANPGLGKMKKETAMLDNFSKAQNDPAYLPTFLTKDLNLPENKSTAWLSFEEATNEATYNWRDMGFRYCVVGYDASDSIDLTAAKAMMVRPDDQHIYEMSHYWIPEDALDAVRSNSKRGRGERDNMPYRQWEAQGLLTIVPGNKIDHRVLFEWMDELREVYDIWPFALGYDPWHLTDDTWIERARAYVGKDRLEPVRQGAKSLAKPMKEIKADFAKHRFINNNNPIDTWCRMNVEVVVDRNDNWLPQKGKGSGGRIDGFMAELMAYIALQRHEEEFLNMS